MQLQEDKQDELETPTPRPFKKRMANNKHDDEQQNQGHQQERRPTKRVKLNDKQEQTEFRLTRSESVDTSETAKPADSSNRIPISDIDNEEDKNIRVKLEQNNQSEVIKDTRGSCFPTRIPGHLDEVKLEFTDDTRKLVPSYGSDKEIARFKESNVAPSPYPIAFNSPASASEHKKSVHNDDDFRDNSPSLLNLNNGHIVKLDFKVSQTSLSNDRRRPPACRQRREVHSIKDQLVVRTDSRSSPANNINNNNNNNVIYSDLRTELSTKIDLSSRLSDIAPPSPPLEDDDQSEPSPIGQHQQPQTRRQPSGFVIRNDDNNNNKDCKTMNPDMDSLLSLISVIRNGTYEEFLKILHGKQLNKYLLNLFVDGQTALHYSLMCGRNLAWCKELVSCGSNPDLMNQDGWHPIHLAAYSGLHETMLYLIDLYDDH